MDATMSLTSINLDLARLAALSSAAMPTNFRPTDLLF